jgi:hypothetical protein
MVSDAAEDEVVRDGAGPDGEDERSTPPTSHGSGG